MKKTLMLMMTVVLCIAAVTSCKKKPEPKPEPEINISGKASIDFSGGATDGTVTFTSSEDWTATAGEGWVHVSQTSGTGSDAEVELTITCDPNPSEEPRTTTVTIKSGDVTKTITITQPGKEKEPEQVIEVQRIDFEQQEYTISVGSTLQLVVQFTPENATDKSLIWQSFRSVASVSEDGVVKGIAPGYEIIRAYAADGKIGAECIVNVTSDVQGSHQGAVTDDMYGGSGSGGDDVSGGSGASQGDEASDKNGFQYKFSDKTVNVTGALKEKMQSLSRNGFALPADPQGNSPISNGDVFVFPPSEDFPDGRAMKVTGIRAEGDDYYYTTTLAAIDEIFETLHIEQNGLNIGDRVEKVLGADGREIDFARTKAGFTLAFPQILGGINSLGIDLNDNLSISPSVELSFNMDLAADVVDCSLRYAKAKINVGANLACDVTVKNGVEKEFESERFKVLLGAIVIGPVIITPEIYVSFTMKLSGEVNVTFSVNYQKEYFSYTYYDGAGGVHSKAGEVAPAEDYDPFAVTGNISGGIEFGPNLGFSLSLYAGALGISAEMNPHPALTFTGSMPFTMETFANFGLASTWLSNAYYEPSIALGFGGSIDIAYRFHKKFEMPEGVSLAYSFGKTYIMPKLGENLDIKTSAGNMAMITTTIKNKAWFDDNMYVLVHKGGYQSGEIFAKCPFEIPKKPEKEGDEVECTAFVRGLVPGERYYVAGPYMTVGAFGYTKDLEMSPAPVHADRVIEFFDPKIVNAVKGILGDIYASRDGDWKDCNWDKDFDNIRNYKNVTAYYNENGILKVEISLARDWKANRISIKNHSDEVENMMLWTLYGPSWYDSSTNTHYPYTSVKTLEIEDKTLEYCRWIECREKIAIHSPKFGVWQFFHNEGSEVYRPDVDLSGSGIVRIEWANSPVGDLVLKNCPNLRTIEIHGSLRLTEEDLKNPDLFDIASVNDSELPESFVIENCPALEIIELWSCRLDRFYDALKGCFVPKVLIGTCVAYEFKLPDCCEYFSIRNDDCIFPKLTLSGCSRLKGFFDWFQPVLVREYTIEDCPLLDSHDLRVAASDKVTISNCGLSDRLEIHTSETGAKVTVSSLNSLKYMDIYCASTADFNLSGLPALESSFMYGNYIGGLLPEPIQQMRKRGKTAGYPHKYKYEYGYVNGEWSWKSTITNDYGFYFPGEPGQHYHFDPKNPNR